MSNIVEQLINFLIVESWCVWLLLMTFDLNNPMQLPTYINAALTGRHKNPAQSSTGRPEDRVGRNTARGETQWALITVIWVLSPSPRYKRFHALSRHLPVNWGSCLLGTHTLEFAVIWVPPAMCTWWLHPPFLQKRQAAEALIHPARSATITRLKSHSILFTRVEKRLWLHLPWRGDPATIPTRLQSSLLW